MTHVVLAYRRSQELILERLDFAESEVDAAWEARDRLTMQHLRDPDVEVVLLGIESEAALRNTHSRYFVHTAPTGT